MASKIKWDIRLKGRAWEKDEAWERYQLTPEKFEMIQGKLFWSDEDRLNMLGMMLENLRNCFKSIPASRELRHEEYEETITKT